MSDLKKIMMSFIIYLKAKKKNSNLKIINIKSFRESLSNKIVNFNKQSNMQSLWRNKTLWIQVNLRIWIKIINNSLLKLKKNKKS